MLAKYIVLHCKMGIKKIYTVDVYNVSKFYVSKEKTVFCLYVCVCVCLSSRLPGIKCVFMMVFYFTVLSFGGLLSLEPVITRKLKSGAVNLGSVSRH